MVSDMTAAAAFLLQTALLDAGTNTPGEALVELTAAAEQPAGSYLLPTNALVVSGGIKVVIATGTGPSRVEHFVGYSPKTP